MSIQNLLRNIIIKSHNKDIISMKVLLYYHRRHNSPKEGKIRSIHVDVCPEGLAK